MGFGWQFPLVHDVPDEQVVHAPLLQYWFGPLHCPVLHTAFGWQLPLVHDVPDEQVAHAPLLQYCVAPLHCPVVHAGVAITVTGTRADD